MPLLDTASGALSRIEDREDGLVELEEAFANMTPSEPVPAKETLRQFQVGVT
jgi:hypothetical protein